MPFDRSRYPPDWPGISRRIRARAAGRCEGPPGRLPADPQSRCAARQAQPHPVTGSKVVLTVAHLCRCRDLAGRKCGQPDHLLALCQRCHLGYDRADHIAKAKASRRARRAVGDLFPEAS